MGSLNLYRWALVATLGHPGFAVLGIALAASWPLLATLSRLGITTTAGTPSAVWEQVGILALLLGVAFGAGLEERVRWILEQGTPGSQRRALLALHATPAALLLLGAWLVPSLVGGAPAVAEAPRQLWVALVVWAHLTVLVRVVSHIGLGGSRSWIGLPLLAWFLPALLGGAGPLGTALAGPLDVFRSARMARSGPFGLQSLLALLPIMGWVVVLGLSHGPTLPHALRRTR